MAGCARRNRGRDGFSILIVCSTSYVRTGGRISRRLHLKCGAEAGRSPGSSVPDLTVYEDLDVKSSTYLNDCRSPAFDIHEADAQQKVPRLFQCQIELDTLWSTYDMR